MLADVRPLFVTMPLLTAPRTLPGFFLSLGMEWFRFALAVDAVVELVWFVVSSRMRLVPPKVPRCGCLPCAACALSIEAAFLYFSCSALLFPAEPFSLMRGPGVFANAFATLLLVGAKWLAPTTLTLPDSYLDRLLRMSVRTFYTVR